MPYGLVEVTPSHIDSIARGMVIRRDDDDEQYETTARAFRDDVEWPTHFPAFSIVLAGADGSVWVQRHLWRDGANRWDVFDGEMSLVGFVYVPATVDLKVVSLDAVYGIELDSFDVPWIVRFDISG